MNLNDKMVEVVAALIWDGGKFLICQRPENKARGLLWEFVGGKVELGESKQDALKRECREELAVEIEVGGEFFDVVHNYPDISVHLTVYDCIILKGTPTLLEHNASEWITPEQIRNFEFCPADEQILERIVSLYDGKHYMRLADTPFAQIRSGLKTVEVRLYDEKRRKIAAGDTLFFTRADGAEIKTKVISLHRFESFEKLFASLEAKAGGGTAEDMYAYYTPEDEKKYGVLGIELKRAGSIKIEHYSWNADSIYRLYDKRELMEAIESFSRDMSDPTKMRAVRMLTSKMHADGADMPQSPSWEYCEFQKAAVAALCALVKKPTDRRCDVLKRARGKLERAKGRDKELYERIVYELKCADMRQFAGLKAYIEEDRK